MKTDKQLLHMIEELAPWHHGVNLRDNIWTESKNNHDHTGSIVHSYRAMNAFEHATKDVLPNGMEGRSFLDCACNCGGYSFSAKDKGASKVYGFDARERWIEQARFIAENREADSSDMTFKTATIEELGAHENDYDVTWFGGIFYHLPDPVAGLKKAADRTKELLFLNTTCLPYVEGEAEEPMFKYKQEGVDPTMSGVDGPSWTPSGPVVLTNILNWLGFPEVKVYFWRVDPKQSKYLHGQNRIAVVAAREEGRLSDLKSLGKPVNLESS